MEGGCKMVGGEEKDKARREICLSATNLFHK